MSSARSPAGRALAKREKNGSEERSPLYRSREMNTSGLVRTLVWCENTTSEPLPCACAAAVGATLGRYAVFCRAPLPVLVLHCCTSSK